MGYDFPPQSCLGLAQTLNYLPISVISIFINMDTVLVGHVQNQKNLRSIGRPNCRARAVILVLLLSFPYLIFYNNLFFRIGCRFQKGGRDNHFGARLP